MKLVFQVAGTIVGLGVAFGAGVHCGGFRTELRMYRDRYEEERTLIQEALGSDPAFARIRVWDCPDGCANLEGEVATSDDHARLVRALVKAVWERRGKKLAGGVLVAKPPR